jgi:plasmid stabilization system protein ParE
MKYRISRRAVSDIERIYDRIATYNLDAAERMFERIYEAIRLLARFPEMGHTRADVNNKRYLFMAVSKYVVVYRIERKELQIVRVIDGVRDFKKLFNGKH